MNPIEICFHLEDAFNLADQGGAVIGASFGEQLGPAPDDVVIDGVRALLLDPTAIIAKTANHFRFLIASGVSVTSHGLDAPYAELQLA
jgi:hypothetical protein